jgi:hypothetical protein
MMLVDVAMLAECWNDCYQAMALMEIHWRVETTQM